MVKAGLFLPETYGAGAEIVIAVPAFTFVGGFLKIRKLYMDFTILWSKT